MECNCNNNNNGGVIPWVRGNRLPLCICIYQMNVDQGIVSTMAYNTMTRTPYEIQADDTVTVTMKSGFRSVEMPFTTDGNKVLVIDNGELPTGTYTVEVTIERGSGERGRWQESRQVRIYENTDEAILGEMYSIEADLFFWAKGDTGVGIANITSNPDDTLTITMTDGTTYTTQAMKGDKGDKGDQGEKGASIVSFDVTGQTETSVIYTVTFSDDTTEEVAVPKGPQGDTGLTGNGIASTTLNSDYTLTIAYTDGTTYTTPSIRGAQGVQGVSIIAFTQTGETATNTLYNVVFSDGRTQSVAIPKGVKGDKGDTGNPGSQGAQGPKGDTVTATDYTLYNVQGSDSQGAMSQDATTKAISAQTGYYTCGTAAGTPEKVVTVESGNVYKRTLGGHFKVKMTNANTAASGVTLQVGSETATALWYNGAAVSASNTWEENEVISVYFDGTNYQASNAQGGGGKAEKIKYDNSKSGLVVENVQNAIDGLSDQVERESVLRFDTLSYSTVTGYDCFITNNNVLYDTTNVPTATKSRCVTVYTTNYSCVEITANSNGCYYAFLKSFTPPEVGETDEQPDFCDGYESRYLIASNQKKLLFLPQDCNILYIYEGVQTAWRPTLVRVGIDSSKFVLINKTAIDDLQIKLSVQQEVNYADMTGVDGYLADNGMFWDESLITPVSAHKRSVPIPVDGCLSFSYIASANGIKYAFLTSRNFTHRQRADFVEGYEYVIKDTDNDGTLKYVPIPYGCKYLYVYDGEMEEGRRIYRPQYISRGYAISSSSEAISADLNEVKKLIANAQKGNSIDNEGRVYPDDVTILNVERRASQMLDVQWTALAPIASTTSRTGIAAGEHTGLPYTSCMEVDKFVGYDVTLLTFMTAANNPYSLLYTEDLKVRRAGQHGSSGYGFTYHGTRATIGGYMGIVCNIFALGSDGMEIPYDTGMFAWLAEQGIFTKIYDQSAQGVRIGDVIWEPGHGNIVTDLWRNQRGEVTYIDWSESKANFPVTTHMTPTQFNERLASNTGIIYRYNELYKNIKYTPSPFVAVEEETPEAYVYNDDICTFAGDYACFRVGFPIYINYNLKSVGAWTTMQLYKDDTLLNTYNLDTSTHKLSLGSSLEAGTYKARLANGSTYSDYTYFEVIETTVSYSNVGEGIKKVTFESSNGTPMYVRCSGVDGAPMCLYPLTDEDVANGYCDINFRLLIQKQYNNLASHTGNVYCKVTFKGEYGRVTNEPILTDL